MLVEAKRKTKYKQYEEIGFIGDAEDEFGKYIDFLYRNSERFQNEIKDKNKNEIEEIEGEWRGRLEKELKEKLNRNWKHRKSIYPSNTEYGKGYNMLVDTINQRVFFYEIRKGENGLFAKVHKCPHYNDFIRDLKEKRIKPKKDADPNILLDLLELERHSRVNKLNHGEELPEEFLEYYNSEKEKLKKRAETWEQSSEDSPEKTNGESDTEGREENGDSKSTKEDPRKIWKRRPRKDGHGSTKNYYNVHNPESSISQDQRDELVRNYEESNESLKDIRTLIAESIIIPLNEFIKQLVG